jgi:DNA-binding transcriptional LysR family regulator
LFTRSVRGLVPTAQAFERGASAPPGELAGVLRLSVSDFIGVAVLPAMLARLRQRHPALILEIETSNCAANLLEQEIDLAARTPPPRQAAPRSSGMFIRAFSKAWCIAPA